TQTTGEYPPGPVSPSVYSVPAYTASYCPEPPGVEMFGSFPGGAAWAVSVHESGSAPSTCFTRFNSARSRVFVMVQRVLVPIGTTIWSRPLGFTPLVQTQEPV